MSRNGVPDGTERMTLVHNISSVVTARNYERSFTEVMEGVSHKSNKECPSPPNSAAANYTVTIQGAQLDDTEFLSDSYLHSIIEETDDRCCCLLVHLGLEFSDLEHVIETLTNKSHLSPAFEQLMLEWRDSNRHHDHRGVPMLMLALRRGGKYDVSLNVHRRLKVWCDAVQPSSPFKEWAIHAYTNPDMLAPVYYPRPLSDGFMMQIAPEVDPTRAFAFSLLMSSRDWEDLCQQHYLDRQDGYIVLKMLTWFCDKSPQNHSEIDKLETLTNNLGNHGYRQAQQIAFSSLRGWLRRGKDETSLKTEVRDLLHRMGQLRDHVTSRSMTPVLPSQCYQRLTETDARNIFKTNTLRYRPRSAGLPKTSR